jgi:hypothetical protein
MACEAQRIPIPLVDAKITDCQSSTGSHLVMKIKASTKKIRRVWIIKPKTRVQTNRKKMLLEKAKQKAAEE